MATPFRRFLAAAAVLMGLLEVGCASDSRKTGADILQLIEKARRGPLTEEEMMAVAGEAHGDLNRLEGDLRDTFTHAKDKNAKVFAAYLLGRYRFRGGASALAKEVAFYDEAAVQHKRAGRFGEYPVATALVAIGKPSTPHMVENIRTSPDAETRRVSAGVLSSIEGKEVGVFILQRAASKEQSAEGKERLLSAINYVEAR